MKYNLPFYYIALAIYIAMTNASSVTYRVMGIPSSKELDYGVVIDNNEIYKLFPSKDDPALLFEIEAPVANLHYYFVELGKGSNEIVSREEFERDPINTKLNQVYGRSWTTKSTKTFERIYDEVGYRKKTDLHSNDEIPTIHIQTDPEDIDRIHEHYNQKMTIKADASFISAHDVQNFSNVKFKVAGRASRFRHKPSYNLKLPKDDRIGGYRSFKLRAAATDPTIMREKLYTDMLIASGLPCVHLSFRRLYVNGVALGLFVFTENFDTIWFDQNANPDLPDYKPGVFYKAIGESKLGFSDVSYIGDNPSDYGKNGYEIVFDDQSGEKGFTVLADFAKFIDEELKKPASNDTSNEKKVLAEWNKYIHAEVFLRNMVVEFLTAAMDNYLSWGENYFLYECPLLKNFIFIQWDLERSLGNSDIKPSVQVEGDYRRLSVFYDRPITKAMFRVPSLRKYFETVLENVMQNMFNPDISFPIIDSIAEQLSEDVEWDRVIPRINRDKDYSKLPEADPRGKKPVKNDGDIYYPEYYQRSLDGSEEYELTSMEFQKSIDGPTEYVHLMGLKEFIQKKYDNVNKYL